MVEMFHLAIRNIMKWVEVPHAPFYPEFLSGMVLVDVIAGMILY